ncbi:hypothetical protein BC831DRAFT_458226 [Entophlyctis helioformis]|nr:hypothetical protein BC831DRAFT_458226 [Entophlyctis helioformis]
MSCLNCLARHQPCRPHEPCHHNQHHDTPCWLVSSDACAEHARHSRRRWSLAVLPLPRSSVLVTTTPARSQ